MKVGSVQVEAGQVIGGKYELERLLGRGSMGEVWRARHTSLEGAYAVKLVDAQTMPDAAGRFQMEAHIAARLSKKTRHIVSVTDHGEEGDLAYLVMQLLDGESLEALIDAAAPLPMPQVAAVVGQVARALGYAQAEGFVHRDLKPGNVFLTGDEDGHLVVKVLDFGIARAMTPVRTRSPFATAKDMLVGTPSYMSPEQALGLDTIDHRCDVWALAVLIYEALTKRLPFEGESIQDVLIGIGIGRLTPIREHRPDLPEAIDAFYAKAFAEKIDDRFATATELATAFARIAGVEMGSRPSFPSFSSASSMTRAAMGSVPDVTSESRRDAPAPGPPAAGPAPRRSRTGLWVALAVLVLVSSAGALLLRRGEPEPDRNGRRTTGASSSAVPVASAEPAPPEPTATSDGVNSASASPTASAPAASATASSRPARPATGASRPSAAPSGTPVRTAPSAGGPAPVAPSASAKPIDRAGVF